MLLVGTAPMAAWVSASPTVPVDNFMNTIKRRVVAHTPNKGGYIVQKYMGWDGKIEACSIPFASPNSIR